MTDQTRPLPCPFCGCDAKVVSAGGEYAVNCTFIGVCPGNAMHPGRNGCLYRDDAVRIWNRREAAGIAELTELYRARESDLLQLLGAARNHLDQIIGKARTGIIQSDPVKPYKPVTQSPSFEGNASDAGED